MAKLKWSPTTPWAPSTKKTLAIWPTWVCRNPSCPSRGRSHPNCKCGIPSFSAQSRALEYDAKGGVVGEKFCDADRKHEPGCEYFAHGGQIAKPAPLNDGFQDDPHTTIGHAAIEHGLLGLLSKGIGHAKLSEPEKHAKVIDDAKAQHKHRSYGPAPDGLEEVGPKKSVGTQLGDHIFEGNHDKSAEMIHSHPLVGAVGKANLEPMLGRLAKPMLEQKTDPEAFRGSVDYLHSAIKGDQEIKRHVNELFDPHKISTHSEIKSRKETRELLKKKLEEIQEDPAQLIDMAGSLGHYLPNHAGHLGATAATAIEYLKSLKPKSFQQSPLDEPTEHNPLQEDIYHRQLDIAQDPLRIVRHTKDGTLQQEDLNTVKTIYPGLYKSIIAQMGEELIKAKADGKAISYRHRLGMSHILGQPLDSTMTQQSMSAIISSAQPPDAGSAGAQPNKSSAVSSATQKTIAKTDSLYKTPLERLETKND